MDRFADRLDPATYALEDEVVGVFESDPSEADTLWLSARLFRRLTGVARAYELHALPQLDDPDPVRLNRARCEAVLDEIAFVAERLDDQVATAAAASSTRRSRANLSTGGCNHRSTRSLALRASLSFR